MAVPLRAGPGERNEFCALDHGLRWHPKAKTPDPANGSGALDACAFHGHLGARVALLQSSTLAGALRKYQRKLENKHQKTLNHGQPGWVNLIRPEVGQFDSTDDRQPSRDWE